MVPGSYVLCQDIMSCEVAAKLCSIVNDKDKMNNEKKNTFTFLKEFISPHMNKKKSIKSEGT